MEQRITVAVRIRPPLEKERYEPLCARKANDGQTIIIKNEETNGEPVAFQFDDVYDGEDDQQSVYEQSVQELVDHALQGVNVTVLTYGQTGSGKTHTILGSMSRGTLTSESGIFLRIFQDLFSYRKAMEKQLHIIIFLSAVELYIEDVMDLLSQRKKIKLRDTPEETLTPGINTVEVETMEDVMRSFNIANTYRSVTSTKMNDSSSRSHALFFIDLFQVPINVCPQRPSREQLIDVNGIPINGSINGLVRSRIALVDLAGSERVKRSGVEGQAMIEAQAINKSLSALGTTINAMYTENIHIPFRDSKLTKLLKPSFVDRAARLLLIGQIAPPSCSAQESQGTLRFCDRVKGLKAGKVVGFLDPEEEERYLRSLRKQEELLADLHIAGAMFYYQPQRPSAMAKIKGISVKEARNEAINSLSVNAGNIETIKEAEIKRSLEEKLAREQEEMEVAFVEKSNSMIEEYETLTHENKKIKKSLKRLTEQQEAEVEEKVMEAKKTKKHRVKLEEKIESFREALRELGQKEEELTNMSKNPTLLEEEEGEGNGKGEQDVKGLSDEKNEQDKLIHLIIQEFHTHLTELNQIHALYVQRLAATQRQRSQVRRVKVLSSEIITDSTLVYDIIDFVIDRAIDIADGVIDPLNKYSWHDIDGISRVLRTGEQWYPPLITEVKNESEICDASVYHNITFLSSDDSDAENSHYPMETRRRFVENNGVEIVDSNDEDVDSLDYSQASDVPLAPNKNALTNADSKRKNQQKTSKLGKSKNGRDNTVAATGATTNANADNDDYGYDDDEEEDDDDEENDNNGKSTKGDSSELQDSAEGTNAEKTQSQRQGDQQHLMRVYDSPTLVQDLVRFLRGGSVMLKHGRSGKPHRRHFWVSIIQNRRKLLWMDPNAKASADRSSIDFRDVSYIQLGCFSKVFKRHPVSPRDPVFYRSFSIGLKDGGRTVDIVADSVPDFEAWVVGLSNLVCVDPVWGGKLDITRERSFESLNCFEASLCESNYIYPSQYIMLKRRVRRRAEKTLRILKQCGNNTQKAYAILKGIHPPAVNEKGALYLTKGELRFMGRDEMDIMRITKIWMLFQQMNIVYDDNFVPATTFGITERH
ncbi:Kinesin motor domain [Trypanosoma melophagium]|uniref:Kinesin motor domain n=1 Tax=Trypanosoma melophagium TaxID=715481 RepID=UPI00351A21C8|nr:Kinesin motor domain [Trypanosoma melophagium]